MLQNLVNTLNCGHGWEEFSDNSSTGVECYRLVQKAVTYEQAKEECEQLSEDNEAKLATINSDAAQHFVTLYLFHKLKLVDSVWIGAKRSLENVRRYEFCTIKMFSSKLLYFKKS